MQRICRRAAPVRFSYYDRHTSLHLHPIQRVKLVSSELYKGMDNLSLDSPHSKKKRKTRITIIVPCIKPVDDIVPTPDNLLRLAFLESAFAAEL